TSKETPLFMTRRTLYRTLLSTAAAPILAYRASAAVRGRPKLGELWKRTELYFGSQKPDGTYVTREEFKAFLDTEITPRFPDGLTAITGYGQFLNSGSVLQKERSVLLILLYPPSDTGANDRIEEIRAKYESQFQQESVLRVDSAGLVSF